MHAVGHAVGGQRAAQLLGDLLVGRDLGEARAPARERRSRARCSSSAKIRPPYSRSPSHTASPPCTTESNGLTAASSRWVSRPADVDHQVAVALVELLQHGFRPSSRRSTAGSAAASSSRCSGSVGRLVAVRPEAGRGLDGRVPVRRPHAVGRRAGRRGHDSIAGSNGTSSAVAQPAQRRRSGSRSRSAASTTGPPNRRNSATCCSSPRSARVGVLAGPARSWPAAAAGRGRGTRAAGRRARRGRPRAARGGSCASGS